MLEELQRAVGGLKPAKFPGPDGFTLQYHQSLLQMLFTALSSDVNFPRDTLKAHISIILYLKKVKTRRPVVVTDPFPY